MRTCSGAVTRAFFAWRRWQTPLSPPGITTRSEFTTVLVANLTPVWRDGGLCARCATVLVANRSPAPQTCRARQLFPPSAAPLWSFTANPRARESRSLWEDLIAQPRARKPMRGPTSASTSARTSESLPLSPSSRSSIFPWANERAEDLPPHAGPCQNRLFPIASRSVLRALARRGTPGGRPTKSAGGQLASTFAPWGSGSGPPLGRQVYEESWVPWT
jgi:hypothetical protein